jgi:hypothetical protein
MGAGAGGPERTVDQGLGPGRQVRGEGKGDRGRVTGGRGLEGLRAN